MEEQKLADLGSFLYRLKNQSIIIRLEVSDAKDAFKLFETINNRGLKLSATDIIKNFILGNAARFGPSSLDLAREQWAALIRYLDGTGFDAFFRHYLCARLKKRITRSFVISNFKTVFMHTVAEATELPDRHWYDDGDDLVEEDAEEGAENGEESQPNSNNKTPRQPFADFLQDLVNNAKAYGQLVLGKTGDRKIDRHLRNLRMIKALQTYGFLTYLRTGGCSDDNFLKVLQLTEAFLLRRHICRERANDNETAFAKLCGVDCANPLPQVIEVYRQYSPSDERFTEDFATADFTANLIERARYCLEQFELQALGKHLELLPAGSDAVHVEHIIPQKIKTKRAKEQFGDWPNYLGAKSEAIHPQFVSRIGNLALFAGALNISASNNPYQRKKAAYANSAFTLTKSLPSAYPEFRFDQVAERSKKFASLALKLWPTP